MLRNGRKLVVNPNHTAYVAGYRAAMVHARADSYAADFDTLVELRRLRDEVRELHAVLNEMRAARLAVENAQAELASLYRARTIARAQSAERDIAQTAALGEHRDRAARAARGGGSPGQQGETPTGTARASRCTGKHLARLFSAYQEHECVRQLVSIMRLSGRSACAQSFREALSHDAMGARMASLSSVFSISVSGITCWIK
jgi:hypothetical protein